VADRLALGQGAAGQGQGAGFAADGADGAAVRTGLSVAQGVGLLFQQGVESAFGQACGGGRSDLLHGVEINVEPGALVAEGAAGNDFAPAGGQVVDFSEEFGGKFATRHGRYRLVLAAEVRE
jgi:hypothetical protein